MSTRQNVKTLPNATRSAAVIVLGLVLAVLIAAISVGQLWLNSERSEADAAETIRGAADQAVTAVLSYDYRRLDAARENTLPLLTGDAKAQYLEVQQPLGETAPKLKAVVTAEVKSSTILEHGETSARVLLFVDQVASSQKLSQPRLDQSRVVVTLKLDDGAWLVSTLNAI